MFTRIRPFFIAAVMMLGIASSNASAQTLPEVPPALEVPEGFVLFSKGSAVGTQNYMCLPAASGGFAWRFFAPEATLFVPVLGLQPQLATHFLSSNPDEISTNRPTWQHSVDSSRIWARPLQSSTDPNYVEPGAIAWLLLEVVGREPGPDGGSFFTPAAYIQRLNTSGGVAPATGCAQAADVGSLALVPYTTDYFFFKSRKSR